MSMTIESNVAEEAIRELEMIMHDCESIYQRSAIGTAIAALERYIPEPTTIEPGGYYLGKCPTCGALTNRGTLICPGCRQALAWPGGGKQ